MTSIISPLAEELNAFFFTMALDTNTQTISFEMSNNIGAENWFGVGFSNVSMVGDAAIVSKGTSGFDDYIVTDYWMSITDPRVNGVVKDTQNDLTNIQVIIMSIDMYILH